MVDDSKLKPESGRVHPANHANVGYRKIKVPCGAFPGLAHKLVVSSAVSVRKLSLNAPGMPETEKLRRRRLIRPILWDSSGRPDRDTFGRGSGLSANSAAL